MERLRKVCVDEVRVARVARDNAGGVVSTGVLVGRIGSGKSEVVLLAVPTPAVDQGVSAVSWAVEHAAAVERMLPGGVDVVGVFRFQPKGTRPASDGVQLARMARAVMARAMKKPKVTQTQSEAIVLFTAEDARLVARACPLSGSTLDLRPLEIRIQPDLNTSNAARTIRSKIRLDYASHEGLLPLVAAIERKLDLAMTTFNGCPVVPATHARLVTQVMPPGKQSQDTMDIYLPAHGLGPHGPPSGTVAGPASKIRIQGQFDLIALVDGSSTIQFAMQSILQDLARTLRARAELLLESVDEQVQGCAPTSQGAFQPGFTSSFPVRVLAQTGDDLWVTDFRQQSESLSDVKERFVDMLGFTSAEIETLVMLEPEIFATLPLTSTLPEQTSKPDEQLARPPSLKSGSAAHPLIPLTVATLVILVAVFVALIAKM